MARTFSGREWPPAAHVIGGDDLHVKDAIRVGKVGDYFPEITDGELRRQRVFRAISGYQNQPNSDAEIRRIRALITANYHTNV